MIVKQENNKQDQKFVAIDIKDLNEAEQRIIQQLNEQNIEYKKSIVELSIRYINETEQAAIIALQALVEKELQNVFQGASRANKDHVPGEDTSAIDGTYVNAATLTSSTSQQTEITRGEVHNSDESHKLDVHDGEDSNKSTKQSSTSLQHPGENKSSISIDIKKLAKMITQNAQAFIDHDHHEHVAAKLNAQLKDQDKGKGR